MDIKALEAEEARRWAAMHIDPARKPQFMSVASRLVAPGAKARYLTVQKLTNVPWWIVAVIHEREAGQDWSRSIAQGDPWNRPSRNVPAGRGPFTSWEGAALDALKSCSPYAARWTDWSIAGSLVLLEEYNGLGYAARHLPSPYDWSGSDQYLKGKYVADHQFDPNAVDKQLGCAALIACMKQLDPDVHFSDPRIDVPPYTPAPVPVPQTPSVPETAPEPAQPWWLTLLITFISALFKGK